MPYTFVFVRAYVDRVAVVVVFVFIGNVFGIFFLIFLIPTRYNKYCFVYQNTNDAMDHCTSFCKQVSRNNGYTYGD